MNKEIYDKELQRKIDTHELLSKIHREVIEYEKEHRDRPQLIIMSRALNMALRVSFQMMLDYHQAIMLDEHRLTFDYLFGIPCLTSLALEEYDFEVR
jgi:hypothetical protein